MGVETSGPNEEDLRIRTEAGEPEEREQDIEKARSRAKLTDPIHESAIRESEIAKKHDARAKQLFSADAKSYEEEQARQRRVEAGQYRLEAEDLEKK